MRTEQSSFRLKQQWAGGARVPTEFILKLQRTIGNRAAQRALGMGERPLPPPLPATAPVAKVPPPPARNRGLAALFTSAGHLLPARFRRKRSSSGLSFVEMSSGEKLDELNGDERIGVDGL